MSAALYIVPERQIEGFDHFVNGKALGRCLALDRLAKQCGVKPLMEFFSQNPEEAAAFLESEGLDPPEAGLAAETWYSPEEGLVTVRRLREHLVANADAAPEAAAVAADLRDFERVLSRLAAEGIRWHLGVDF